MNVIQLTRLRHGEQFFLNPDLIERVDTHVDTVIRLTTGNEHRVKETGDEIVRHIADFRARVLALAGLFQQAASPNGADSVWAEPSATASTKREPIAELSPTVVAATTEGAPS
jgi:uncharacterized protein YlzI (FlbEa/FlbD family)